MEGVSGGFFFILTTFENFVLFEDLRANINLKWQMSFIKDLHVSYLKDLLVLHKGDFL